MRERGVRRLPVVDAGGALVGLVSIDDLIGVMADELGELVRITLREQAREARERR